MKDRLTIWKYWLPIDNTVYIEMPDGAEVLTVQMQRDKACIWALVDPQAMPMARRFSWRGTGHPVEPDHGRYIGTVHMLDGGLVFHLFERTGL
jgi:hypothetical protein